LQTGSRRLERSSLEAYFGFTLGVCVAVIPLHWWAQVSLMTIVGLLAGDIAFHAPWFYLWNKISKGGLWIISIALIAIISYGPIYDQYKKDKMPAGVVEIQQFGQKLVNLSSDILSFTGDRNKNEPSLANASRDDIQKTWAEGVRYRQETANLVAQRFGGRILRAMALLKSMGIDAPWIVQTSMSSEPSVLAKWMAAMGELLSRGKIEEAIKTGPDQQLWWNLLLP
jgi:hypothetical protein